MRHTRKLSLIVFYKYPVSRDIYHDMPYAAAFVVKTLADNQGLIDIYSFFAFTDIFEEMQTASTPFHGCYK